MGFNSAFEGLMQLVDTIKFIRNYFNCNQMHNNCS